jgi:phosphoribosylformylglycinamidine cyclo-ligase
VAEGGISYDDAGVNLDAARALTQGIRDLVHGGTTGFAGTLPMPPMRDPVLVACTDGVGTKVLLARQMGDISGLGQDLVAMSVNDLVCSGATPLFFLDYLAVGRLDPGEATQIVQAVRGACLDSGCVLLGGETAEMPGLYADGHFDMAGFAVGAVERAEMLGPDRVVDGDVIVGIESSGIHSNGFSLVRKLVDDSAIAPDPSLLAPTRLYPEDIHALRSSGVEIHAAAHITGGGLPENLPRAMPDGLRPVLRRGSWPQAPAIAHVLAAGAVDDDSAWDTFNMGLGMCLVMPREAADRALSMVRGSHVVGRVEPGPPGLAWEV